MRSAALCALAAAHAASALPVPLGPINPPATRIAFGSCSKPHKPQPAWDHLAARHPDLFVWLGDIIYADRAIRWGLFEAGNASVVKERFATQKALPGYAAFAASTRVIGVYDDHDMGLNDADRYFASDTKVAAKEALLDFLDEPSDSPRRSSSWGGVHAAYVFGSSPRRVRVILLDNRWDRDPYPPANISHTLSEADGMTRGSTGAGQDMLGGGQWAWLRGVLEDPAWEAEVTLIGAGLQVIHQMDTRLAESFGRLPQSQAKLLALLADTGTKGVVFLSGDVHVAELHAMDCAGVGYPLYDLTSSGMTHSWGGIIKGPVMKALHVGATAVPGAGGVLTPHNFGEVEVVWGSSGDVVSDTVIKLRVFGADDGALLLEHDLPLSRLYTGEGAEASLLGLGVPFTGAFNWYAAYKRYAPAPLQRLLGKASVALDNALGYPRLVNGQRLPSPEVVAGYGSPSAAAAACAAAPLDAGFTNACAAFMATCAPRWHWYHRAYYLIGHGAVVAFIVAVVTSPVWAWVLAPKWPGGRRVWLAVSLAALARAALFIRTPE